MFGVQMPNNGYQFEYIFIGGSIGGFIGAPPNRINFFRFRIRFHRKVYALEVGAPPQREILDPPLILMLKVNNCSEKINTPN